MKWVQIFLNTNMFRHKLDGQDDLGLPSEVLLFSLLQQTSPALSF